MMTPHADLASQSCLSISLQDVQSITALDAFELTQLADGAACAIHDSVLQKRSTMSLSHTSQLPVGRTSGRRPSSYTTPTASPRSRLIDASSID